MSITDIYEQYMIIVDILYISYLRIKYKYVNKDNKYDYIYIGCSTE